MSGADRYWPATIPDGYRVVAVDSSGGERLHHHAVYADTNFTRWLCADASELYPNEPWHGPSMGAEITVAHGSAWLIEDPRWIQALVIDRPSPAYKLTWRINDLIAELVVSTTIAQADAIRIAHQAHFDSGDLALGWVPQDLEHVDVATGVGECPQFVRPPAPRATRQRARFAHRRSHSGRPAGRTDGRVDTEKHDRAAARRRRAHVHGFAHRRDVVAPKHEPHR